MFNLFNSFIMKQARQKFLFITTILLLGIFSMSAEEILLAKYDFSTGSKIPVQQATGVTFGAEFAVYNASTPYNMELGLTEDGYLMVRGYGAGVANNRYGYISITPEGGKTIRITKVVVNHTKEAGSNTSRCRCYLYDMGGDMPITNPTVLANLIYQGTGGLLIPETLTEQTIIPTVAADFSSVKFMSFYATQTTANNDDLSKWKIRSLEFFGEIILPGDIVATKSVDFGTALMGSEVEGSVSMKVVGGVSKNVALELIDPNGAFTCMQTEVEAVDATAGTTIRVTFNPTTPGTHTAQMKFSYDDKVAYTQLTGICPIMTENFTQFVSDPAIWDEMNNMQVNAYNQEDIMGAPGWEFSENIYWHRSGSYALGLEMRGTNTEAPKVSTPELDLSSPFGITFRSKKMTNRATQFGDMFVTVDSDTIFSYINQNVTLDLRNATGFIGTANSKISFLGIDNDSNRIVIDEISIFPTIAPAMTLPSYSSKIFNAMSTEPVTIDIPFKAYNLTGDLTVALINTQPDYEVLTPTIAKANAEAGTSIQVRFTPPVSGYPENAEIKVQGGGLTSLRTVNLVASNATGITENTINAKIYAKDGFVRAKVDEVSTFEIFSYDGKVICRKQILNDEAFAVNQGLYIVRIKNASGCKIEKVLVK